MTIALAIVQHPHDVNRRERAESQLNTIEQRWKSGAIKDPAEITLSVARIQLNFSQTDDPVALWVPIACIGSAFVFILLLYAYAYFNPIFNFLWGDYVARYEKRRSLGRFLLGGVLLAIAIGIVANLISKHIGI